MFCSFLRCQDEEPRESVRKKKVLDDMRHFSTCPFWNFIETVISSMLNHPFQDFCGELNWFYQKCMHVAKVCDSCRRECALLSSLAEHTVELFESLQKDALPEGLRQRVVELEREALKARMGEDGPETCERTHFFQKGLLWVAEKWPFGRNIYINMCSLKNLQTQQSFLWANVLMSAARSSNVQNQRNQNNQCFPD